MWWTPGIVVAVLALAAAVYVGLGGRAIFGTKEKPGRILGAQILLFDIDGLGETRERVPATVTGSDGAGYRISLDSPLEVDGKRLVSATIYARHDGYPISRMPRSKLRWFAVNGRFESGESFTASARRL